MYMYIYTYTEYIYNLHYITFFIYIFVNSIYIQWITALIFRFKFVKVLSYYFFIISLSGVNIIIL